MTNLDKIRNMNAEEFAEAIIPTCHKMCKDCLLKKVKCDEKEAVKLWLESEVEE